jgi:hypothetical protein
MEERTGFAEVLKELGDHPDRPPPHAVQHGAAGTLLALRVPTATGSSWQGAWIRPDRVEFLGEPPQTSGLSRSFHLTGDSATLIDLLAGAARAYIEQAEAIDEHLTKLQSRGRELPASAIWERQRQVATLRASIGRAVVVVAEVGGPSVARFPGVETALAAVAREVDRSRELAAAVQQSLSDLILLRSAEEANRIAEAANQLSRTSNRIAELANISNIRMLGLTYLALLIGLVGAVVLIPNTAATILGMPSAGWVPGLWVDVVLVVLAIVPFVAVFSRPWVKRILRDLGHAEGRAQEGVADLPEVAVDGSLRSRGGRNDL